MQVHYRTDKTNQSALNQAVIWRNIRAFEMAIRELLEDAIEMHNIIIIIIIILKNQGIV